MYPYWYNAETDTLVQLPERIIRAAGTYGFDRILSLDLTEFFESVPTEEQLRDRQLTEMQAGNIAEAAIRLNNVFESAQAAADQYLENIITHCMNNLYNNIPHIIPFPFI